MVHTKVEMPVISFLDDLLECRFCFDFALDMDFDSAFKNIRKGHPSNIPSIFIPLTCIKMESGFCDVDHAVGAFAAA